AFICTLLGIRHLVLAVNKMDLVGFDEYCFEEIAASFASFAARLGDLSIKVIPLSARFGDNVTKRSPQMPWYQGPSLLEHLQSVEVTAADRVRPFRFPVQWVNRPNGEFRGFSGTVASGSIAPGETVLVAGTARSARINQIVTFDGNRDCVHEGEAATLTFQ